MWTNDYKEIFLFEGAVSLFFDVGAFLKFSEGDLITFSVRMKYWWDVHKLVRKDYRFGD